MVTLAALRDIELYTLYDLLRHIVRTRASLSGALSIWLRYKRIFSYTVAETV